MAFSVAMLFSGLDKSHFYDAGVKEFFDRAAKALGNIQKNPNGGLAINTESCRPVYIRIDDGSKLVKFSIPPPPPGIKKPIRFPPPPVPRWEEFNPPPPAKHQRITDALQDQTELASGIKVVLENGGHNADAVPDSPKNGYRTGESSAEVTELNPPYAGVKGLEESKEEWRMVLTKKGMVWSSEKRVQNTKENELLQQIEFQGQEYAVNVGSTSAGSAPRFAPIGTKRCGSPRSSPTTTVAVRQPPSTVLGSTVSGGGCSSLSDVLHVSDVFLTATALWVYSPQKPTAPKELIMYKGRNVLDLGGNIRDPKWDFSPAQLPLGNTQHFLENVSQYQRLTSYGQTIHSSAKCCDCDFEYPII